MTKATNSDRPAASPSWLPIGNLHYGWVIASLGVLVSMCVLGIARFAFGMLLPSMGEGLALSYGQMGTISTANFIGYLLGALLCSRIMSRTGARQLITIALAAIFATLALIAFSSNFWQVLTLFTITGLGSGTGNVAMVGLVSHWFQRSLRGRAAGLVVSGSGFAIMLSGVLIPAINNRYGPDGWRYGWIALAGVVALVALVVAVLMRSDPADVGLKPAGEEGATAPTQAPIARAQARRATWHLGLIYVAFGFSYVIYVTFIVTTLVDDRGFSESTAGWFWFAVGFFSIFSGPIFGSLSDRVGRRLGLAAVFGMHITAYLLVGIVLPTPFLYLSVFLFGLSAWSIPGIVGAAAGDYLGPSQAVHALGILTVFFGVGQAVGPAVSGVLADRTGSFDSSFLLAAALSVVGAVLSLLLKPPSEAARHS